MATIQMSAQEVILACQERLEAIKNYRKEEDEKMIATEMGNTYFSWRKLSKVNFTRDEAIQRCKTADLGWWFPCRGYHSMKRHVEKLLILAKLGDPVTLNEEDTNALFSKL